MAEALLLAKGDLHFRVFSAGLDPRPLAVGTIRAMNEIGIDISHKRSKSTKEFLGREVIHHAIFLCSESETDCPRIFPFATHSHQWRIPAPHALAEELGSEVEAFREVRNLIDEKIREFVAALDTSAA